MDMLGCGEVREGGFAGSLECGGKGGCGFEDEADAVLGDGEPAYLLWFDNACQSLVHGLG